MVPLYFYIGVTFTTSKGNVKVGERTITRNYLRLFILIQIQIHFCPKVSGLHTDMVKWMVQMLLRLAPDREDHSQEAREAVLMGSATVLELKSNANNLFHQLQSFTKYVFQ